MSAYAKIPAKLASEWLAAQDNIGASSLLRARFLEAVRSALSALDRKRSKSAPRRAEKKQAKASKREETSRIYEAVEKRANGICECGCGRHFGSGLAAPQMDHQWGRGKVRQSVENCWMLTVVCHDAKGRGVPSRLEWLVNFLRHAHRYGYVAEERKAELERQAEAISRALPASPKLGNGAECRLCGAPNRETCGHFVGAGAL